jgi:hypothetical protein
MTIVYKTETGGNTYSYDVSTSSSVVFACNGLPNGLTFEQTSSTTASITGRLIQPGRFAITILANNSAATAAAILDLTVEAPPTPIIISDNEVSTIMGDSFSYQIESLAFFPATSYTATNLPTGLSLDTVTGIISGTPTSSSSSAVVTVTSSVYATNVLGSGTPMNLVFTISQRPVITSSLSPLTLTTGTAMTPYTITATKSPILFGASPLPDGLQIDSETGVISGTPSGNPTVVTTHLSADNGALTGTANLSITVNLGPPTITSAASVDCEINASFSFQLSASPGPILSYSASNLPTGLSLNTSTGIISGTPTTVLTPPVTITSSVSATNAVGTGSPVDLIFTLKQRPVITSSLSRIAIPLGSAMTPYTITATQSPTVFGAANLPSGVLVNSNTGVISGTCSAFPAASYNIVAGSIDNSYNGYVNGPAATSLFSVDAVPFSHPSDGNIYIADGSNRVIRKLSSGIVSTFAGQGPDYAGLVDGVGSAARFLYPGNIRTNSQGDLYVRDFNTLRKVTLGGNVTTIVNLNDPGWADGPLSSARFRAVDAFAIDSSNNIYVFDYNKIRKITPAGQVTTIAGPLDIVTFDNNYRPIINGTGTSARFYYNRCFSMECDTSGNVYIMENQRGCIRKITPAGVVTTLNDSLPGGTTTESIGYLTLGYIPSIDSLVFLAFSAIGASKIYAVSCSTGVLSLLSGNNPLFVTNLTFVSSNSGQITFIGSTFGQCISTLTTPNSNITISASNGFIGTASLPFTVTN